MSGAARIRCGIELRAAYHPPKVLLDGIMNKKRFNVVLDSPEPGRFEGFEEKCRQSGVQIERRLEKLGVATVIAEESTADELRRTPGVLSVEEDRDVRATS
jgi:hypothetical protein